MSILLYEYQLGFIRERDLQIAFGIKRMCKVVRNRLLVLFVLIERKVQSIVLTQRKSNKIRRVSMLCKILHDS